MNSPTISTFVCVCEPDKMGFPIREAVKSYLSFSDEVVVIYGRSEAGSIADIVSLDPRVKIIETHAWPLDWHYDHMRDHIQKGIDSALGDFILKIDADCIFHDESGPLIRQRILGMTDHVLNFNLYSYYHPFGFRNKGSDTMYCLNVGRLRSENIKFWISNETGSNLLTFDREISRERENSFNKCPVNYDDTFLTLEQGLRKWYYWHCALDKKNNKEKRYGDINNIDMKFMTNDYVGYKRGKAGGCSYNTSYSHPSCIVEKFGVENGILNLPDKFKKF